MSLSFFYEILFLKAVVMDIVAAVTKVVEHSLDRTGAAAETDGGIFYRAEAVLSDLLQNVIKSFLIRSVVHNTRPLN